MRCTTRSSPTSRRPATPPLFGHGGDWTAALSGYEFDEAGRVSRLTVRYPAYFTDGEPESRARIEQVLQAKAGRGREYHFTWDEEGNELTLCVLPRSPPTSPPSAS